MKQTSFSVQRRLLLSAAAALTWRPSSAPAAQGAAEMDLEFYVKGLVGAKTTPAPASLPPPVPRALDAAFATAALGAAETAVARALGMTPSELRAAAAARRRALEIEYVRVLTSGAFGSGYDTGSAVSAAPSDQFGFDLSLLSLFGLLADAQTSGRLRRADVRTCLGGLGATLLAVVPGAGRAAVPAQGGAAGRQPTLASLIGGMRALLDALQAAGYVRSYAIDDTDADEALWQAGGALSATRLSVTLTDSATLRGALVLDGRVSPEITRLVLTAYLEARAVEVSEVSELFLDSIYRPNPREYRADQQLLALTIAPRAS